MRWVWILAVSAAWGQTFDLTPGTVRQGETIKLRGTKDVTQVRLGSRTVPLFAEPDGGRLGLMPVPVDHQPGKYPVEFLDAGGGVIHTATATVLAARFPTQNIVVSPSKKALEPLPGEMEAVAALRKAVTGVRHWEEPFLSPVPGCMNSPFGVQRLHNGEYTGNYHRGVDLRGPAGRPIRAVAGGVVRIARMFNLHGGTVGIDHGQGLVSMYLHMSKLGAAEGAVVKKGDVIGNVGATGFATGPHLHWSLYVNGVPVEPRQWVKLRACGAGPAKKKGRK
ncbi:MAG TPA: M23 family metallopeptidase [Bryobacteraceae bacterium]|nr:M23 family metallopeptidase [Bryobacteraceae bacterium]